MAHNLLLGLAAVWCLATFSLLQADAAPLPGIDTETCPVPPVQLGSNTSVSVHPPPFIDYIRYGRLQNIQTVNYADITELYVITMEVYQTLTLLTGQMTERLGPQGIPAPHHHRFIPERNASSLTDFNITERLTEDQCILTNLTAPLHCVMLYEVEHFNGQLNLTLEDIEDRIVNLLESLENVTGVPLPPDVDTSTLEVPTADPSSRNENPGAEYGDGDNDGQSDLDLLWSQQLHPMRAPPLATCGAGPNTNPKQVEYVQELWIAVWYLWLDLKESKLELSP